MALAQPLREKGARDELVAEIVADFIAGMFAVFAGICCQSVCQSAEHGASADFFRGMQDGDGGVGKGEQASDIAGDVADFLAGIVAGIVAGILAGAVAEIVAVFAGGIAGVVAGRCMSVELGVWQSECEVGVADMRVSPFTRYGRIYLSNYRTFFRFCQGRDVMMDGG